MNTLGIRSFLPFLWLVLWLAPSWLYGAGYNPPAGGWSYIYSGDAAATSANAALDGTWSHNNGSDNWALDGRGPGNGPRGGVERLLGCVLTNETALTIEDAVSGSGAANDRIYFVHPLGPTNGFLLDQGVTLSFRARLTPLTGRMEAQRFSGASGDGYGIFDNGKGMFSLQQSNLSGSSIISFSLVNSVEDSAIPSGPPLFFGVDGLTMNPLNGDVASGNGAADSAPTNHLLNPLLNVDPSIFHEFWITIMANDATPGNGTHTVRIYVDGEVQPATFNVTAARSGNEWPGNYLGLGLPSSGAMGAFDVDFLAYKEGVQLPVPSRITPPRIKTGIAVAWGDDESQQVSTTPSGPFTAIVAGGLHSLALTPDGQVVGWGSNSDNQSSPQMISRVIAIGAGYNHSLAVTFDGLVAAWGSANNDKTFVSFLAQDIVAATGASHHSIALHRDGTVIGWGLNVAGEARPPANMTGVRSIAAGESFGVACLCDGSVTQWGSERSGLPSGNNFVAVAAGELHAVALRNDGTVVTWETQLPVPQGLTGVVAIAAGAYHTLALKNDGAVVGWRSVNAVENNYGQFTPPSWLRNAFAISTGYRHSVALVTPPNDYFADRALLAGTNVFVDTSNLGASAEPNEPAHNAFAANKSSWWTWTAPRAGAAIISVESPDSFFGPVVAVYTGNALTNLTGVVTNFTFTHKARVIFNVTAETTYQIAVDSREGRETNFVLSVTFAPPPPNDTFADRSVLSGSFLTVTGSFLAATREFSQPLEPTHGSNSFESTRWWSWTAPTNTGFSNGVVTISATAVGFIPDLGVYEGGPTFSNLTSVSITTKTNGVTRSTSFAGVAGQTYLIALAGLQFDRSGSINIADYGQFGFSLTYAALTIQNLSTQRMTNGGIVTFTNTIRVSNHGTVPSAALRLHLVGRAGHSQFGDVSVPHPGDFEAGTVPVPPIPPGTSTDVIVVGMYPAPIYLDDGNGVGWGLLLFLEELAGGNWFVINRAILDFGDWPIVNGNPGPGGGIIRLDPTLAGSDFDPGPTVFVIGADSIWEGDSTRYEGLAAFINGVNVAFTNTAWTNSHLSSSIATNGLFRAGSVTNDITVMITCPYYFNAGTHAAQKSVRIVNLAPPRIAQVLRGTGGKLILALQGVVGRKHFIEVNTNLNLRTQWTAVATNQVGVDGMWIFTNQPPADFRQLFYRAREAE